jgi:hypothetical protein
LNGHEEQNSRSKINENIADWYEMNEERHPVDVKTIHTGGCNVNSSKGTANSNKAICSGYATDSLGRIVNNRANEARAGVYRHVLNLF